MTNALPYCFNCKGPVHGGPCDNTTTFNAACQACRYRAAQPNGLCDICERREQIETALTMDVRTLLRFATSLNDAAECRREHEKKCKVARGEGE